jgi:hypothetical protein
MVTVALTDIESVDRSELSDKRLNDLQNGYSSFDEVLKNSNDPIALDKSSTPYRIIDGRHRIYLARKNDYRSVNVRFI